MAIASMAQNFALYVAGIALSCGPSQIYGIVKGAFDIKKYLYVDEKIKKCEQLLNEKQFNLLKGSAPFKALQKAFPQQSEEEVLKLLRMKNKEERFELIQEKNLLSTSLKADLVALIPFVGALCAWRIDAGSHAWELACMPSLEFSIAHACNHQRAFFQKLLYPLNGTQAIKTPICEKWRVRIPIPSRTGHYLDALFLPKRNVPSDGPAIVLFHGNGMTCHNFAVDIQFFHNLGFHVLAPTIGGYPGSSAVNTSEASTYQDVEAVKQYLKQRGITKAGYYGLSIGGSLAFQAAIGASEAEIETLFVIADKTFSSGKNVMENFAHTIVSEHVKPFARGISHATLPHIPVRLSDTLTVHTDGLNNAQKTALLKERNIPLLAIKSTQDALMGWNFDEINQTNKHNFADQLIEIRYGETPNKLLLHIDGDHNVWSLGSEKARDQIANFVLSHASN